MSIRKYALLKAATIASEAPDESRVTVIIHDLGREQFDSIPGTMERKLAISGVWAKDVDLGGNVTLELYTGERSVREAQDA